MEKRSELRKKKKIVIKVGSSTITHEKTGQINIEKIEKMARRIADLKGMGKEVILVSSGAIAAGRQALGNGEKPKTLSKKQAFSAVGQDCDSCRSRYGDCQWKKYGHYQCSDEGKSGGNSLYGT